MIVQITKKIFNTFKMISTKDELLIVIPLKVIQTVSTFYKHKKISFYL
jgi:hypothetical protein